jgi:hypothetical protein
MPKIKLNFKGDELTNSNISVVVEEEEVEDLFAYYEHSIEKVGDADYDVDFEWSMLDSALIAWNFDLVFVMQVIYHNCELEIESKVGPFTILDYEIEGKTQGSKIGEWKFHFVKDASDNFIDVDETASKQIEEYLEYRYVDYYSYGIFQKVVWDKITKEDLKYQY